jgi:hypothetical protein
VVTWIQLALNSTGVNATLHAHNIKIVYRTLHVNITNLSEPGSSLRIKDTLSYAVSQWTASE